MSKIPTFLSGNSGNRPTVEHLNRIEAELPSEISAPPYMPLTVPPEPAEPISASEMHGDAIRASIADLERAEAEWEDALKHSTEQLTDIRRVLGAYRKAIEALDDPPVDDDNANTVSTVQEPTK